MGYEIALAFYHSHEREGSSRRMVVDVQEGMGEEKVWQMFLWGTKALLGGLGWPLLLTLYGLLDQAEVE